MKDTRDRRVKPVTAESEALHRRALGLFPGGVNSPVRAFRGVGGVPRAIASAQGAWMTDADGNRLLDYVLGWGPLLLGHAYPAVVRAVEEQMRRGALYGAMRGQRPEPDLAIRHLDLVQAPELLQTDQAIGHHEPLLQHDHQRRPPGHNPGVFPEVTHEGERLLHCVRLSKVKRIHETRSVSMRLAAPRIDSMIL